MEDVAEAFADSVDLATFLTEKLPKLFASYVDFEPFLETDIIVSLYIEESAERYSISFGPSGKYRCEKRELVDFPQVTLSASQNPWDQWKPFLRKWIPELIRKQPQLNGEFFLSRRLLEQFSKIDGVIDFSIKLEEGITPRGTLILNNYDPPSRVKRLSILCNEAFLWSLLDGKIVERFQLGHNFKLKGDLLLAGAIAHIFKKI